jgi:diguanylate cyclase (GGDEF)-like protein
MQHPANLTPEESLALAVSLEENGSRRFRLWALRFRPFDPGLGLILDMQAREMESHRAMMMSHISSCPDVHTADTFSACADDKDPAGPEHFFIIDMHAAVAVLNSALQLKSETLRCYRACLMNEPRESALGALYRNLGTFTEAHTQILQEAMERLQWKRRRQVMAARHGACGQRTSCQKTVTRARARMPTRYDAPFTAGSGPAQTACTRVPAQALAYNGRRSTGYDRSIRPAWHQLQGIDVTDGEDIAYWKTGFDRAVSRYVEAFACPGRRVDDAATQDKCDLIEIFDPLTKLPNRLLLGALVDHGLAQAQRAHQRLGILLIDLDHFRHVNNSLGHQVGDELLKAVVQRLQVCIRKEDIVARLSSDAFTLMLEDVSNAQQLTTLGQTILAVLDKPFRLGRHEVFVSASMGISLYPDNATDRATLLTQAATAMYSAKTQRRSSCQYYKAPLARAGQQ